MRELRVQRDWRLEDLAARSGLSLWTVQRTEIGRTSPGRRTKVALAKALKVPVGEAFPPLEEGLAS